MANKLKNKKPAVQTPANPMAEDGGDASAKESAVLNGSNVPSSRKDVVNTETARVLRDADAGKNLLDYTSLEDMFKDLGM
jgi:hypothetical protein